MAAELTFTPGRVPGIAKAPRSMTARSATAAQALPPCAPEEALPPMTARQREALAALIHTPAGEARARFLRDRAGAGIVFAVVTASALAWTLAIAVALVPELRIARAADLPCVVMPHLAMPHVAMPHVVEGRVAPA